VTVPNCPGSYLVTVLAGVPGTAGLIILPLLSITAGVAGTAGIFVIVVTFGVP